MRERVSIRNLQTALCWQRRLLGVLRQPQILDSRELFHLCLDLKLYRLIRIYRHNGGNSYD
jgi:hypothetical protein